MSRKEFLNPRSMSSCRYWLGDRPCRRSLNCSEACPSFSPFDEIILLVHLGALGAVVRSTSLLAPLKRAHPRAKIYWLTDSPAHHLLQEHPSIDRVFTSDFSSYVELKALEFSCIYVVDKSLKAGSLAQGLRAQRRRGFGVDFLGRIFPQTPAAEELFELGLDNHKKFFQNKKPETQLLCEALELDYRRDPYDLPLTTIEMAIVQERRTLWQQDSSQPVIGFNTGCSSVLPAKKWSVEFHQEVLGALTKQMGIRNLVLLGGPEDRQRNRDLSDRSGVRESPTNEGLRDGLISVAACDIVVSGDSLGMHMAISQGRYVVAWFGPTCSHEIDLFNKGQALQTRATCSPCWDRSCRKPVMCYDQVGLDEVLLAIRKGVEIWSQKNFPVHTAQESAPKSLLSKPRSLEISS